MEDERMINYCVEPVDDSHVSRVMVWSAIHKWANSDLVVLDSTKNHHHYIATQHDPWLPWATAVIEDNFEFVHDYVHYTLHTKLPPTFNSVMLQCDPELSGRVL